MGKRHILCPYIKKDIHTFLKFILTYIYIKLLDHIFVSSILSHAATHKIIYTHHQGFRNY